MNTGDGSLCHFYLIIFYYFISLLVNLLINLAICHLPY